MALHLYSVHGSCCMVYIYFSKSSSHCFEQKCSIMLISQAYVVSTSHCGIMTVFSVAAIEKCCTHFAGPPHRFQVKKPQQKPLTQLLQKPLAQLQQKPLPQPPQICITSPLQPLCHPSRPPHLRPQATSAPGRPCSCARDTPSWQRASPSTSPPSALWRPSTCQLLPAKLWRIWAHGAKSSGGNVSAPACSAPHKPNAGQPAGMRPLQYCFQFGHFTTNHAWSVLH